MTPPASFPPDRPFPGALSQVPRLHAESDDVPATAAASWEQLPLEASRTPIGLGWTIRLPVRAEHVTITKEVVVREAVVLRRREVDDVARLDATVRREELRVETEGEVEVKGPLHEDLGGARRPRRGRGSGGVRRS